MRWAGLALIALVSACSTAAAPSAVHSPAAAPSAAPASAPAPAPTKSGELTCRLPVHVTSNPTIQVGGFIQFPEARYTVDGGSVSAGKTPGYFDRSASRWLPVGREAVSPDGTHYAYSKFEPGAARAVLHIVEAISGREVTFDGGPIEYGGGGVLRVVDYTADGLYLKDGGEEGLWNGLWLMNPTTGARRSVPMKPETWIQAAAANRSLWVGSINPKDPHPWGHLGPLPDQVEKLNLADGSRASWLYRPGSFLNVIGEDVGGHPIVTVTIAESGIPSEFLLVLASGPQTIARDAAIPNGLGQPIADAHGLWFGSADGIYLYTRAGGLKKVADQPGYPANGCA